MLLGSLPIAESSLKQSICACDRFQRFLTRASKLRSIHAGYSGKVDGSAKHMNCSSGGTFWKYPFSESPSEATSHRSSADASLRLLARKKPCCLSSTVVFQACTAWTSDPESSLIRRTAFRPSELSTAELEDSWEFRGSAICHAGSETRAGNPARYVNLYFFKSAKQRMVNLVSKDGFEKTDPSLIASQI